MGQSGGGLRESRGTASSTRSERTELLAKARRMSSYHLFKSFMLHSTWQDVMFDFGIVLASVLAGMAIYFMIVRYPPGLSIVFCLRGEP